MMLKGQSNNFFNTIKPFKCKLYSELVKLPKTGTRSLSMIITQIALHIGKLKTMQKFEAMPTVFQQDASYRWVCMKDVTGVTSFLH